MVHREAGKWRGSILRWMPWYGPALLAGFFLLLIAGILVGLKWQAHYRATGDLKAELATCRQTIANRLEGNLDYLKLLAAERSDRDLSQETFQAWGAKYVLDHPEFINFTWVDAQFVIQDVCPRAGNEQIIGLSLTLQEPARASRAARETGEAVYTTTFEAIQGNSSFEVWVPVFRDKEFLGLFAGVYSCQRLLDTMFDAGVSGRLELVAGSGATVARLGETEGDWIASTLPLSEGTGGLSLRLSHSGHQVLTLSVLLISALCVGLALSMGWAMWALRRDAQQLRQAREDALESQRQLQLLEEYAPMAILVCEAGQIITANAEAHALFGATGGRTLVGLAWEALSAAPAPPSSEGPTPEETVLGGQRMSRLDGAPIEVEVRSSELLLSSRAVTQYIVRDLSAQKQALKERLHLEAQIQHTQKLESLGVLAGGIAHDFNNLLVGILGYADLALMVMAPAATGREHVEEIVKSAQRAADLCNQMLAYSGKGRFVVKVVDLSELVEEMSHLLEISISKRVSLQYRFGEELPAVEVDVTQMRQVIMNLITNASDAVGDANGIISVSTGALYADEAYLREVGAEPEVAPGQFVFLEVSDSGSGMDKATMKRIFEPFYTSKETGRGLGLAAVQGIVRGHGGVLKVYSEVGRGTTMKVVLPASSRTAPETGEYDAAAPGQRGTGTILIVDDEPTVQRTARGILRARGYETLHAASGEEGLALYRERHDEIVAVLLDMTMPGISGEETFSELRRINPTVKVVLSSGYNEQDVTNSLAGKGLAGFLQKPYRAKALLDVLHRIISRE